MSRLFFPSALLVTLAAALPAVAGELRAGAATSNITPPLGSPIVGSWNSPPAATVHDELHARCLVLESGEDRLALVVVDNVGVPREVFDRAKRYIADEAGIPPRAVLAASTHTHTAVSARDGETDKTEIGTEFTDYQNFLARRIADGVRRAAYNLEPAKIGWGHVAAPEHVFNRRWYTTDARLRRNPFGGVDEVRMNPPRGSSALLRPAGPVDPEVLFLSVRSREKDDGDRGRPIALLANYSLHYVGGGTEGELSADYFGAFARNIADRLGAAAAGTPQGPPQGPPFVGILSNGTSGDVNNIDFTAGKPKPAPYAQIEAVADDLAAKVAAAEADIEFHGDPPLGSVQRELTLGVRHATPEQAAHARDVLAREGSGDPYHKRERNYARKTLSSLDNPDEVRILLQAHRIGDLAIAAIPFEVFAETGLELKDEVPFGEAFTMELANGSYGYLPTPEQHRLGGYETWIGTNTVETDASRKIVAQLLDMFAELKTAPAE